MEPSFEVGQYCGELLHSESEKQARYGLDKGLIPRADWEAQRAWSQERQDRGVSVTGAYVFVAGKNPVTGRQMYVDGEHPGHANWTRFVNHSASDPNIEVVTDFVPVQAATPQPDAPKRAPSEAVAVGMRLMDMLGMHAEPHQGEVRPLVRFIVKRPIPCGEELVFNYGTGYTA